MQVQNLRITIASEPAVMQLRLTCECGFGWSVVVLGWVLAISIFSAEAHSRGISAEVKAEV